jgi:hypothetical protein
MGSPPPARQVPAGNGCPGPPLGAASGGYCEQPHGHQTPSNNLNGVCMLRPHAENCADVKLV